MLGSSAIADTADTAEPDAAEIDVEQLIGLIEDRLFAELDRRGGRGWC